MGAYDMKDHTGKRLNHGKAWVNDVYIHYATGGSGPLVVLLHGVPKSMFFWRHVIPLLTPHYTVLAADLRGFGDSERPATGYDTGTLAEDIAAAVASLGHKSFRLVGEDWGAAVAYVIAARYPERVEQLVFEEMLLPGLGWVSGSRTEGGSGMKKLKNWDTRRLWHKEFFSVPGYPEMLIPGQLRPFWSMLMRAEMHDPSAFTDDDINEYCGWMERPDGLRTILEIYRQSDLDAEQNQPLLKTKLRMPVLAVGARHFFGDEVQGQMELVAEKVSGVILDWGHNLPLEAPDALAAAYLAFFRSGN